MTAECYDADGWYRTGDVAMLTNNGYQLLGRNSSDIIKSSGYKLSSLEIERELLGHPLIQEVVVLGWPDVTVGEIVAAVIVIKPEAIVNNSTLSVKQLQEFLEDKLAKYKQPRMLIIKESIPR